MLWSLILGVVYTVGALVCAVVLYFLYLWTILPTPQSLGIPGPKGLPVIGLIFQVLKNYDRLYDFLYEVARKYNTEGVHCLCGLRTAITLLNPEDIEHVLKDNFRNYEKPVRQKQVLRELLGDGIFNVDGEKWRSHRKSYSYMFSTSMLRGMYQESMTEIADKITQKISLKSSKNELFDIQNLFFRATMDSICLIAFGQDVGALDSENAGEFSQAFDACTTHAMVRTIDLFWKWKKYFQTAKEREYTKHIRTVNDLVYGIIEQRRKSIKDGSNVERFDVLSVFLKHSKDRDEYVSDETLRDVANNIILAGRDTTACVLSWMFYELAKNPDMQERARKEIRSVTGGPDGKMDYADVAKLHYLEALLFETLRYHPSVPGDVKSALKDDVLPSGFKVPAGVDVVYSPYTMGRWADLWEDPLTFNPDRWLGEDNLDDTKRVSHFKFIAFNAGPRLCLGKQLALVEAKAFACAILNKFEIKLVPNQNITYAISVTMNIKGPLNVTAHPIE